MFASWIYRRTSTYVVANSVNAFGDGMGFYYRGFLNLKKITTGEMFKSFKLSCQIQKQKILFVPSDFFFFFLLTNASNTTVVRYF